MGGGFLIYNEERRTSQAFFVKFVVQTLVYRTWGGGIVVKSDLSQHEKSSKHKRAQEAHKTAQPITPFMIKKILRPLK